MEGPDRGPALAADGPWRTPALRRLRPGPPPGELPAHKEKSMPRIHAPALALLALTAAACADVSGTDDTALRPQESAARATEQVMPGEVLVKFRAGSEPSRVVSAHGLRLVRS